MSTIASRPRSISGTPLAGGRLVRFIYVDEAGTSAREPFAVVAGIMVHADSQWRRLEQMVSDLVSETIPEAMRGSFLFHATELFSGGKKFPRDQWPMEKRWSILDRLLSIPSCVNVPVVFGFIKKREPKLPDSFNHGMAYTLCMIAADQFLRRCAPDEIATVIAEDAEHSRRILKKAQVMLQNEILAREVLPEFMNYLPVTHIKDTVHFALKSEAILLQIADACAFTMRHYLTRGRESERFIGSLCGGRAVPIEVGRLLHESGGIHCLDFCRV